ncbi:MAG: 30S ribosomal protein S6 [Spirochaetes bacterium]|nr:30S ribosomal protein S6 [Spirochaetota bacterium]
MNSYELTIILRPNETLNETRGMVEKIFQKHGANIKSVNEWGRRKLAYPIDRNVEGFYLIYHIEVAPEGVKNLTSEFRLMIDILRFLFVKIEEAKSA